MLNNLKVPSVKQIIMKITIEKRFCLACFGWLVVVNLNQSLGFQLWNPLWSALSSSFSKNLDKLSMSWFHLGQS